MSPTWKDADDFAAEPERATLPPEIVPRVASLGERGADDEDAICARILRIRTEALRDPTRDDDLAFTVRELLRILANYDALRARIASLESELSQVRSDARQQIEWQVQFGDEMKARAEKAESELREATADRERLDFLLSARALMAEFFVKAENRWAGHGIITHPEKGRRDIDALRTTGAYPDDDAGTSQGETT